MALIVNSPSTARLNPSSYCTQRWHPSSRGQPPLLYLHLCIPLHPPHHNHLCHVVQTGYWPIWIPSLSLLWCQSCVCTRANKSMLVCSHLKRGAGQRGHTEDLMRIAHMHDKLWSSHTWLCTLLREQRNHGLKYESDCVRIIIGIKIFMSHGRFCKRLFCWVFIIHTAIERKHFFCFRTSFHSRCVSYENCKRPRRNYTPKHENCFAILISVCNFHISL